MQPWAWAQFDALYVFQVDQARKNDMILAPMLLTWEVPWRNVTQNSICLLTEFTYSSQHHQSILMISMWFYVIRDSHDFAAVLTVSETRCPGTMSRMWADECSPETFQIVVRPGTSNSFEAKSRASRAMVQVEADSVTRLSHSTVDFTDDSS